MRGHVLVQLDGDGELAQGAQRLVQLDFAAIEGEALLFQRLRDVARGHRPEKLVVFAGAALETTVRLPANSTSTA